VPRRAWQFRPRHQHLSLTITLPTQCHPNQYRCSAQTNRAAAISSTGC
jgi:hypothetical protein